MKEYFDNNNIMIENKLNMNMSQNPVKVRKTSWSRSDSTLTKIYLIKDRKQKESFIVEILKYMRESSCEIEFTCKKREVIILIRSLSPYISELEIECSSDLDKIKKDIMYYYASKE